MIGARGGGLGREHGFALKGGAIRPGQHKDLLCQAKRQIGGQGIRMLEVVPLPRTPFRFL